MASITPAQRVFGIGMTPIEKAFRPPEGMEYDPAYNDFARQKWAKADMEDAQREAVRAQTEEARARREQLAADRATRQIEDDAIAAMKERPDEIPNILRSFPELARSRNLNGVLNYAQAVTPTAGQKTLAPSLRMKLDPSELRHFDEAFNQTGDALSAYDQARLKGENERSFAEMLGKGVPLEVAMQHKDKMLTPFERAALVQQHANKGKEEDANEFSRKKALDYLFTNGNYDLTKPEEFTRMQADVANVHKLFPTLRPNGQPQPPAIATPAEGGNVAPAPVAPISSVVPGMGGNTVLPEVQKLPPHHYVQEINAIDTSNPVSAKILADLTEAGDLPIEAKRAAVAKLGKVVESPPDFGQLSLREIAETKHQLSTAYEKAKNSLQMDEIIEKDVKPAWTKAKSDMEKLVDAFAAKNKVSPISVYRSIASGEYIPSLNEKGIVVGEVPASVAILGDQYMTENPHLKSVSAQVERMHNKESPIFARINRFLGGEKVVNGDVLNELAQEKAKPVASITPVGRVASTPLEKGQKVQVEKATITKN